MTLTESIKHTKQQPYLSELAEFEWALQAVLEEDDVTIASVDHLRVIPPENWAQMQFILHSSVRRFYFQWNIFNLWRGYQDETMEFATKEPRQEIQRILVWRQDSIKAHYCTLSDDEDYLLALMHEGKTFADICEALCENMDQDAVAMFAVEQLQRFLQCQMIAKIEIA